MTASLYRSLVLSLLAATAGLAAAAEDITVWSAVALVMYGERTPLVGPTSPELTPLGAQQMYTQGTAFRSRYVLDGTSNASAAAALPIYALEPNALDTTQISVLSTDDSYVVAGALAFMQGLYPPQTDEFAYDNGGRSAAVLANGALVNFPLDGYQYPLITTASLQDPASSWIEGHIACTNYQEAAMALRYDDTVTKVYNSTLYFYQQLWPTIFQGVFTETMANFYYAYDLYDFAAYQYSHDPQVANTLNASQLDVLKVLASTQQLDLNANLTGSGSATGEMIHTVAGRMLAQQVVTLLRKNMLNNGANNKLSLMFASFEPFLSFFAVSGLLAGQSAGDFETLPGNGGTMIFELYSLSSANSAVGNDTIYPSPQDLHVRFLYVPDTDANSELTQYALLTNDTSQMNMTYPAFASAMEAIGIDSVATWCDICGSVSTFCPWMLANAGYGDGSGGGNGYGPGSGSSGGSGSNNNNGMAPAVAGVIGALVTLAVAGLVVLGAMLLGGMRFYFAGRRGNKTENDNIGRNTGIFKKRFSFGGGFKGGERKVADADVAVSKAGVGHERVGSWELRDGNNNNVTAATAPTDVEAAGENPPLRTERVRSTILNRTPDEDDDDDDIMADLNRGRVDPREHI